MHQIDINLLEAWNRIGLQCQRNRVKALGRMRRRYKATVFAPLRPWCLCIRAADTRINAYRAVIDPPGYDEEHFEHDVTLDGKTIGLLTKPVRIDWPGVPLWEAAGKLGRTVEYLQCWRKRGVLLTERYDYCRMHGKHGKPLPIVWSPGPIDPNNSEGRAPDSVWGSLWEGHCEKLPGNFEQTFCRVPRLLMWKGDLAFRGWDWACPGRLVRAAGEAEQQQAALNIDGKEYVHRPCGRVCKYLFAPLPVWTLARAMGGSWRLEMPKDSGLAGAWEPGMDQVEIGQGMRRFACKHCWGVRSITLSNYTGWNDLVTHISGGLLYGHEVERPLDEAPYRWRRRCGPYKRCKHKTKDATAILAVQ